MRLASNTDFDLPDVILTRTDVMIRVHCTENMDLMLNNQRKSCSIVKHIEINNITDFEIQNENKTSKISAHTISQDWTDKMDNVFNSETDMLDKPDILTKTPQETIINSFGNLFMLEDGKPHKVNIAVSGITIIILTGLITGLLCFWKKHPTCASRLLAQTGSLDGANRSQEQVDYIQYLAEEQRSRTVKEGVMESISETLQCMNLKQIRRFEQSLPENLSQARRSRRLMGTAPEVYHTTGNKTEDGRIIMNNGRVYYKK